MKFENIIICNDVRKEDNGKHILIGVYNEELLFSKFPGLTSISIWMQFHSEKNGKTPIELRILFDKQPILSAQGNLEVRDYTKLITTFFPPVPIRVEHPGLLTFQLREVGKRWRTIKKNARRYSGTTQLALTPLKFYTALYQFLRIAYPASKRPA